jgi:integrase
MSTQKRNGVYHFRLRIPSDLQSILHKREIVRSLKTGSHRTAKKRAKTWESRIHYLFTILRSAKVSQRKQKEIGCLAKKYYEEFIRNVDDDLDEYYEGQSDGLSTMADQTYVALFANNLEQNKLTIDECIVEKSFKVERKVEDYQSLCLEFLKAQLEACKVFFDSVDGKFTDQFKSPLGKNAEGDAEPTELLSKIITAFIGEHEGVAWRPRTGAQIKSGLAKFIEVVGDRPVVEIQRQDIRSFKDFLLKLPSRRGGQGATLSASSVNKYIAIVTTLFNWANDQGYCEGDNPASNLKVRKSKVANEERSDFSDDDLKLIFSGNYYAQKKKRPDRYFIPLILLHSGARLEEIAQLDVGDVKKVEGVWCFDINPADDKFLKTKGSKRVVPIHSHLINLGFLDYLESLKQSGSDRLFPQLTKSANGYGSAISKWFNPRLRKMGIKDPEKVLHSTRHTVITQLKYADAQNHTIAELVGHTVESITVGRYGKKLNVKALQTEVEKLDFKDSFSSFLT